MTKKKNEKTSKLPSLPKSIEKQPASSSAATKHLLGNQTRIINGRISQKLVAPAIVHPVPTPTVDQEKINWLTKISNIEFSNINAMQPMHCFDFDDTLIRGGFGGEPNDIFYFEKLTNWTEGSPVPEVPKDFLKRLPVSILGRIKSLSEQGDQLYITSYTKATNSIIHRLLLAHGKHYQFPELFPLAHHFCWREDDDNFRRWSNMHGKNIHILMAFLTYLEKHIDWTDFEKSYEWKKDFATQMSQALSCEEDAKLDAKLIAIIKLFKELTDHKKIFLYDDDTYNCFLASTVLNTKSIFVKNFNLADQLAASGISFDERLQELDLKALSSVGGSALSLLADEELYESSDDENAYNGTKGYYQ